MLPGPSTAPVSPPDILPSTHVLDFGLQSHQHSRQVHWPEGSPSTDALSPPTTPPQPPAPASQRLAGSLFATVPPSPARYARRPQDQPRWGLQPADDVSDVSESELLERVHAESTDSDSETRKSTQPPPAPQKPVKRKSTTRDIYEFFIANHVKTKWVCHFCK